MLKFYRRTAPIVFRQQSRLFCVRFAKSHEWIDFTTGKVGITDHAQELLGEIVFCDLPGEGDTFDAKDSFATVESVKAASDVYAPVSGTVVGVNEELSETPGLINDSPEGDGWFVKIEVSNPEEKENLMTKEQYEKFLEEDQ